MVNDSCLTMITKMVVVNAKHQLHVCVKLTKNFFLHFFSHEISILERIRIKYGLIQVLNLVYICGIERSILSLYMMTCCNNVHVCFSR